LLPLGRRFPPRNAEYDYQQHQTSHRFYHDTTPTEGGPSPP
jgi:hypothetical protein